MAKRVRTYSSDKALVAKRRTQIVHSAMKLFLERGYKGTTMRELSKVTGMAPGAVYHYIGSKKDILHLICLSLAHPGKDLEAFVCGLGSVSVTEALRQSIKSYLNGCDDARERNIFFNREIGNFSHQDRRMLLESQIEIVEFFEKLIIKGIEKGEFQTESPLFVAHNILMLGHDWGLRQWFLRQYFTLEEYTENAIDLVLKVMLARSGTYMPDAKASRFDWPAPLS